MKDFRPSQTKITNQLTQCSVEFSCRLVFFFSSEIHTASPFLVSEMFERKGRGRKREREREREGEREGEREFSGDVSFIRRLKDVRTRATCVNWGGSSHNLPSRPVTSRDCRTHLAKSSSWILGAYYGCSATVLQCCSAITMGF